MTPNHLQHLDDSTLKALNAAGQVAESLEREDLESEITRLNLLKTPFFELLRSNEVKAGAYEHEYNVVTNRHDKIGYSVFRDGSLPRTVEIDVARRKIRPTLMGQRIQITELALRTTEGGVMRIDELAKREKLQAVIQETEYLSIYGDNFLGSDQPGSPNNLQHDGIVNIIKRGAPMNVVDGKGRTLNIDMMWEAERRVVSTQALANPTDVFISYADKQNLQHDFYAKSYVTDTDARRAGLLGADAQSFIGIAGEHTLHISPFVGDFHSFTELQIGASAGEFAVPSVPTSATVVVNTDVNAFVAGDEKDPSVKGKVVYAIKAANFSGEAAAIIVEETATTEILVGKGQRVDIQLQGVSNAKWFDIYRMDLAPGEDPSNGRFKFLKRVPHYNAPRANLFDDGYEEIITGYGRHRWRKIPGTGVVFGVDKNVTAYATWIGLEQYALPPALTRDNVYWRVSSLFSRAPEFSWLIVNVGQDVKGL